MPRTIDFTDILIGTWNVRSMYRTGIMMTIVSCLERYNLDITAIQEVRWDGSGSLKSQEMTILYSEGEKHERGVGFVIKNSILLNVVRFEPINDRICYVELKGKWFNILLINCYALRTKGMKKKLLSMKNWIGFMMHYQPENQKSC